MTLTTVNDRGLTTPIDLLDNEKIRFGTGNDFEIYHSGSDSFIDENGSGDLKIRTVNGNGIQLLSGSENMITCSTDGAVKVYYDNSQKLESDNGGVKITGRLHFGGSETYQIKIDDNQKIRFGAGDDLQIYHDGDNSYITHHNTGNFKIQSHNASVQIQTNGTESSANFEANGKVELYYDNSKKLETTSTGATITGKLLFDSATEQTIKLADNRHIHFGDGADLKIYHDGSNSYINDGGTGDLYIRGSSNVRITDTDNNKMILCQDGGETQLYYDGAEKLNTLAGGIEVNDGSSGDSGITAIVKLNGSANNNNDGTELVFQRAGSNAGRIQCQKVNNNNTSDLIFHTRASNTVSESVRMTPAGVKITSSGASPNNSNWDTASAVMTSGSYGGGIAMIDGSAGFVQYLDTSGANWYLKSGADDATPETNIKASHNGAVNLYYDNNKKLETTSWGVEVTGRAKVKANDTADYAFWAQNDGDSSNRYGILIQCGGDAASGTNYALGVADGDGTTQGYLTFTGGTLSLVAFTASHPCIIPDADNPSDSSMAYPYGTLLETISIQYSKNKKDGSDTERGIRYKVQKTQSANSRKVLGAYAGSMNGGPEGQTNEHDVYVLGDGHILVNNAGGNIEIGDGICSSATAGIGQKATANPSMIIGIAQEAITFTGSETKLVAVQYGLQQFIPWT